MSITISVTAGARNPKGAAETSARKRGRSRVVRRYRDESGATRELIVRPAAHGTVLVIDRDLLSRGDERLLAHLAADEPLKNAAIVCRSFLGAKPSGRRCRAMERADADTAPFPAPPRPDYCPEIDAGRAPVVAAVACAFRLQRLDAGMSIPAVRWTRAPGDGFAGPETAVSLREAIAALESYEPLRGLTRGALARFDGDPSVSSTVLRAELLRVLDSPIVLNRALREAVLAKVSGGETSLSELAIRCGRLKRDAKGRTTGETSWLARRIGLLPEGGHAEPTRWVHSDVLALIAREGLGIAPREVELG